MNLDGQRDPSTDLSSSRPAQTATVRRLRTSRQHLGVQRHDLLIAMRVVNSIEREMLQAEWENWLIEESAKCKQLQTLIHLNNTDMSIRKSGSGPQALPTDSHRLEEIRAWHRAYCDSCNKEQELVGT